MLTLRARPWSRIGIGVGCSSPLLCFVLAIHTSIFSSLLVAYRITLSHVLTRLYFQQGLAYWHHTFDLQKLFN